MAELESVPGSFDAIVVVGGRQWNVSLLTRLERLDAVNESTTKNTLTCNS